MHAVPQRTIINQNFIKSVGPPSAFGTFGCHAVGQRRWRRGGLSEEGHRLPSLSSVEPSRATGSAGLLALDASERRWPAASRQPTQRAHARTLATQESSRKEPMCTILDSGPFRKLETLNESFIYAVAQTHDTHTPNLQKKPFYTDVRQRMRAVRSAAKCGVR